MDQKNKDEDSKSNGILWDDITSLREHIASYNQVSEEADRQSVLLYVDDEDHALSAFRASFRREYSILTTNSTQEAREFLSSNKVDLIISDQRMPEETGIEFLSSIRNKYPDIVRMLLTGYSDINDAISAINQGGIYSYLSKPYRHEEMKQHIKNALEVSMLRGLKKEFSEIIHKTNKQLEFILRQRIISETDFS